MERLTDKIASLPSGSTYFSLEFFPPKTPAGTQNLLPRLHRLARLRPLFVTVTWGAGGSTSAKSLELAEITQQQLGLTTCLHLTCTNMRRSVLDAALDECVRIGVRNILALRGDEPRKGEYDDAEWTNGRADGEGVEVNGKEVDEPQFEYAIDLVRYIKQRHGAHFCIGVAGYPEGHATSSYPTAQSPDLDLPHLVEKTRAGADFIMTQLFYDVEAFRRYEVMLRGHESGVFKDIPIIPGLMPIHSWQILTRTAKLSCANLPQDIRSRLEAVKSDDDLVKREGIKILSAIVSRIKEKESDGAQGTQGTRAQGFHFYTLNLEKAVAQILESCSLVNVEDSDENNNENGNPTIEITNDSLPPTNGAKLPRRRHSSFSNRAISFDPSSKYTESPAEAGLPLLPKSESKTDSLTVSEGRTTLGREATWDDFPNGRWGDARSPAYGSIDGYGPNLHVSPSEALKLWGSPRTNEDITALFTSYLQGSLTQLPWSEEPLSAETHTIVEYLLALTAKGWWTMASQPAVDGVPSSHDVFGWGPKRNGFVFQKPFVEFFIPSSAWTALKQRLDSLAAQDSSVTYFAANAAGDFESSDPESVNPVTWGAFRGKEIVTPTIIEGVSFRAWREEAFAIWGEWGRVFERGGECERFLRGVGRGVWLVNVIGHEYRERGRLWEILLGEGAKM